MKFNITFQVINILYFILIGKYICELNQNNVMNAIITF